MREIIFTKTFKRDVKRLQRQGKDCSPLPKIYQVLAGEQSIPTKYRDHALKGNWQGHREMHLEGDVLLIYQISGDIVYFVRVGSHSELLNR